MILAVEDGISEAVSRRLITDFRKDITVSVVIGLRGKPYLESKRRELNRTAGRVPVFLLIDLDTRKSCPADVAGEWFPGGPAPNMLFRVAVMEVESWLLADRTACAALLGVSIAHIPVHTDCLDDPKQFMVNLARRSKKRNIQQELVPPAGSRTRVGPAYNARMTEFVSKQWDPSRAMSSSESLRRAVERLRTAFQ